MKYETAYALHKELIELGIVPSCVNCDHWSIKDEGGCCLYGAILPPPYVIVLGCDQWSQGIIPF